MSESYITEELISNLSPYFDIEREVPGVCSLDGSNVRIDLMIRAKEMLQKKGFTERWIGVECKFIEGVSSQTSKSTKLVWQSITYAQSKFILSGIGVIPECVLIYTPPLERSIEKHLEKILELGLYGRVGRLFQYHDGNLCIKFAWNYAKQNQDDWTITPSQLPKFRTGSL